MDRANFVLALVDDAIEQHEMFFQMTHGLDPLFRVQRHHMRHDSINRSIVLEEKPHKVQAARPGKITKNKELVDIPLNHGGNLNRRSHLQASGY
jgi:hypothetical protein